MSSTEKYNAEQGGEFLDYLRFQFLLVERDEDSSSVKPLYDDHWPRLAVMPEVSGFFEQVGNNTEYIFHPEEILADNFALLVLRARNLRSPSIVKKLRGVLHEARTDNPQTPRRTAPDPARVVAIPTSLESGKG